MVLTNGLVESKGYDAMGGIIGGDADLNAVTFYDLNPVLLHAAGENTSDNDLIIAFDFHSPATQYPGNNALQLD